MTKIDLLDKGYVRFIKATGTEVEVANAARVSFEKESELDENGNLKEKDIRLINYLGRGREGSPFRHLHFTFECYAPLMIARQWFKYAVGSSHISDGMAWNESSRRYISESPAFHIPNDTEWRGKPDNAKQGSGPPVNYQTGRKWTERLHELCDQTERWFEEMQEDGICPEQARLFLPAYAMYIRWRWTCSLQTVLWFLEQRLADKAQKEIHDYADAVKELVDQVAPNSLRAWLGDALVDGGN